MIVSCFGDDHDIPDCAFDRSALQLFRDFSDTRCRLHQSRMRHPFIPGDLLKHFFDVHGIVEALVIEARGLQGSEAGC